VDKRVIKTIEKHFFARKLFFNGKSDETLGIEKFPWFIFVIANILQNHPP
jgi:hypothetical protein